MDQHVILLCELEDLEVLDDDLQSETQSNSVSPRLNDFKQWLPDFVIDSGRSLLFDDFDDVRRLRFAIGPVNNRDVQSRFSTTSAPPDKNASKEISWSRVAVQLSGQTEHPITVVYAPKLPTVMGKQVAWTDDYANDFQRLATALRRQGVLVVDCSNALRQSAHSGLFPHGFQNGLIGSGHLNSIGYKVVADEIAAGVRDRETEPGNTGESNQ